MPSGVDDGGVIVSFRDMYSELARLTGELRDVNAALKTGAAYREDHETRIRMLERWRYSLPVSLVLALGSAGAAAAALWRH